MTISVNKVILQGTIGKDIETKVNGTLKVGTFSVCTSEWIASKNESKPTWHNVKVLGKQCELVESRALKGSTIYLEGKIDVSTWNDKDTGEKKSKTEILCDFCRIEPKRQNNNADNGSSGSDNSGSDSSDENDLPF